MSQDLLKRITVNPAICHGKPIIRNTRYMVESILEYLSAGDSIEELLKEFQDLEREDILACIAYATEVIKYRNIKFIAA
jgi:uncharacterized protein (DUF433 family)